MFRVVVNGIGRTQEMTGGCAIVPGIGISVEAGKVTAADFQTQAVSFAEYVARCPHVQRESVNLSGVHERGLLL